jgi:hypothetical protein
MKRSQFTEDQISAAAANRGGHQCRRHLPQARHQRAKRSTAGKSNSPISGRRVRKMRQLREESRRLNTAIASDIDKTIPAGSPLRNVWSAPGSASETRPDGRSATITTPSLFRGIRRRLSHGTLRPFMRRPPYGLRLVSDSSLRVLRPIRPATRLTICSPPANTPRVGSRKSFSKPLQMPTTCG